MIRAAGVAEAAQVLADLQALAQEMGDPFRADLAQVAAGLASGAIRAELAEQGLALWSPFLSTTRGAMGAYVSDLWVGPAARGQGLGARLLASVRDRAAAEFGAVFLRLAVYEDNAGARLFYDRLGFCPKPEEIWLTLEGKELAAL
ncbi:GNAT family N-acetyltransferase [Gemmobacter denitrificans]|uniref:GNAT family N-acetyltransferase n=1 Tax=Gemmobacter denitrificans TaxID=3123040 RepID=A0ABU8BYX8_9RHOB